MTHLNIKERRNESITILDLKGKLKLGEGCSELHQALQLLQERGEKKILLNMADVSFIDSSGLGELVTGYKTFSNQSGEMKLLHLSDKIHNLMTITKLLTVFDVYENEQEAINSFDNSNVKTASL